MDLFNVLDYCTAQGFNIPLQLVILFTWLF